MAANSVEALSSIMHALPDMVVSAMPFGLGVQSKFGGSHFGHATSALSKGLQILGAQFTFESVNAGKKAGFTRALQDRIMQANAAGYEIKQIDKQILAQEIRIQIANQEIINQQKMIDHAQEMEEFLKNKYTNEELYTWMRDSLKTLYHQVYDLTYELAKKAEKVYRFERGLSHSDFIQAGYWNPGREGLLAGEQLYVGLKQLEAAYHENRGYDYEITKHISLRQINPLTLLELKETGKCEFALPEILFDMDYPGHYKRRIKSLSVSIPCIAGPYTGLNATLRLLDNKFRHSPIARNKDAYPEQQEESDDRFSTFHIPVTAIAASSAQNDSGMFELNFKDERYLPFEGSGVISTWRLELPEFRQFDYQTISDVILHMRYIASEGGGRLSGIVREAVTDFLKTTEELCRNEGLFAIIDLKHDLPNEWHRSMQEISPDGRILLIPNVQDFLPYYTKFDSSGRPRELEDITVSDVYLFAQTDTLEASEIFLLRSDNSRIGFTASTPIEQIKTFFIHPPAIDIGNWKILITNVERTIEKGWMVIKYKIDE